MIFACLSPVIAMFTGSVYLGIDIAQTPPEPGEPVTGDPQAAASMMTALIWIIVVSLLVAGLVLGLWEGRKGIEFAYGRYISLAVCLMCGTFPAVLGYSLGYIIGGVVRKRKGPGGWFGSSRTDKAAPPVLRPPELIATAPNPYKAALSYAFHDPEGGGGFIGWDGDLLRTARPRGAMLVIGPPGSSKTTAVIIPSVLLAPGACVNTSPKSEILLGTARLRAHLGRNWQFDPSTVTPHAEGVAIAHWSPLVAISDWDSAARRAAAMTQPFLDSATGNGKHFVSHAGQIVSVLLYAAHLSNEDMPKVYSWVTTLTTNETQAALLAVLFDHEDDDGAVIATDQAKGYFSMSGEELAKYVSSATEILEAYKYVSVRRISTDINFDPRAFVRSRDTLHITVPEEYQHAFAPIVTALLDAIRNAAYELHRNRELGREPQGPHCTFVLDEVTNIAPVPLPQLVSQAGGQGLHVIAAMQSNTQAIDRWKNSARDFLSMFPTKLILPGVADKDVLNTLSELSGEFDRVVQGYSQSTSYVGRYSMPVTQQQPNWSIQRQRVLTPADIANPPAGYAVMYQGAQWGLIELAPVFGPFWQTVIQRTPPPALTHKFRTHSDRAFMETLAAGNPLAAKEKEGNHHEH